MGLAYVNRFGRRGTRGLRPWILLPKVLCVAVYLGGLAAIIAILLATGFTSLAPDDPQRLWVIDLLATLFRWLIVPPLLGAIAFGIALLMQHPRQFLRLRWLIVKLIALAGLIPAAHFWSSSRLHLLRLGEDSATAQEFFWGLVFAFVSSAAIVIIARLKPRLGQNWAKDYIPPSPATRQHE